MRRLMILIAVVTMSFTAFSQTLKPTVLTIKTDTNFCFTIPQSKTIAKYLVKGKYADTLETNYAKLVQLYDKKEWIQDSIQFNLKRKIHNLDQVNSNQVQRILSLNKAIANKEKQIKREKWKKGALGLVSTILTGIVIFK